ncbi:hypothetical protein [Nocardioides lacus]
MRSAGRGPAYLRIGSRVIYRVADVESYEQDRLVVPARDLHINPPITA